jgi:hypothetical protein
VGRRGGTDQGIVWHDVVRWYRHSVWLIDTAKTVALPARR